jgi:hypothetical protein
MIQGRCVGLSLVILMATSAVAFAQTPGERLRTELEAGRAAQAVSTLRPLAANDAEARMALGFAQFMHTVERLAQGLHRYGLKSPANPFLPIIRVPVPSNRQAEALDYPKLRALYQTLLDDLTATRATFAAVPSNPSKIVLDLNAVKINPGSVVSGPQNAMGLRDVIGAMGGRAGTNGAAAPWDVAFDYSDTLWLSGYTHVLSAMIEFVMAHDWQKTYDATAHLFFDGARPPKDFLPADPLDAMNAMGGGIADQIAFLHLMQWSAGDKVRMSAARGHLKSMIATSRDTWKAVLAETDDDREWLPSPTQQSRAVPSLPITADMVESWHKVLDEFDALLDGRALLAHWRFKKGIDLKMFFEEPKPFDLVLAITGHGMMPFLKDGPVLDGTALARWNSLFRSNFLGYAFFIN